MALFFGDFSHWELSVIYVFMVQVLIFFLFKKLQGLLRNSFSSNILQTSLYQLLNHFFFLYFLKGIGESDIWISTSSTDGLYLFI